MNKEYDSIFCYEDRFFENLYKELYQPIYLFTLKYVVSSNLAQDLTQDVFLKIWEKREQLKKIEKLNSYVYTIAKHHTLDYLRKIRTSDTAIAEITSSYRQKDNKPSEEMLIEKEYFEFLDIVIQGMSDRRQEIFLMCREEGKSYKEVAESLGVSRDTVKYHMVESMRTIRTKVHKRFKIKVEKGTESLFNL